jgi:hypothetical protein
VSIHTKAGHIVNAVPHYGGVNIIIECDEGVCEGVEFAMNRNEWLALVAQGCAALALGNQ